MNVVVQGILTNYVSEGMGPVIICLHGWGSSADVFTPLMKELSRKYRVVAVDLPGFGRTAMPKTAWGLTDYAQFVASFINKIDCQPSVVVGHSNGAAIAIKAIANGLIEPEKLVMLGGAGIRSHTNDKKRVLKVIAKTGKALTFVLPPKTKAKVRSSWYNKIGSEMLIVPGMEETFRKIVAEDVLPLAKEVETQTLLIYGESDEATPPLFGQLYFQTMPNAQLEIIGGAGHYVFLDKQQQVTKLVKDFIR